jgi:chemotaxis protein CheD
VPPPPRRTLRSGAGRPLEVYRDPRLGHEAVQLLAGDFVVTAEPLALVTVLGSCVAACLRDPVAGLAALNHFLLPGPEAGSTDLAHGRALMDATLAALEARGARPERLELKLFGGANVLPGQTLPVGTHNAEFALRYFAAARIPVLARDLGGEVGRRIVFFADTGEVWLRRVIGPGELQA